jgi:multiple sugar transport system substrate-binding protein
MTIDRRSFLFGASGVAALTLAGCGGVKSGGSKGGSSSSGGASSVTTQGFGKPDDVGQARIDAFKKAYPQVTVRINEGDFDPQQFLSSVASGNPSDLVYLDRGLIGTYAAKGALQPLDDLISDVDIDTGQYRKPALKQVTVDDKIYGIPEFYNTRNILINGKALREAGMSPQDLSTTDWNKLHANAAKLYRASGSKISRIGFDPKLPEFLPLWAKGNGADLVNEDGSPNLDDPKTIEALTFAYSLIQEQGGWSKFKAFRDTWDIFGSGNEFVKNQAVAFPWEGWYVNVLVQSSPNLDLQSVQFTDRQGNPTSFCDGSAWAIPKGAKNTKAAAQWMKAMTATDTWLQAGAARAKTVEKNKSIFTGLWTANTEADRQVRDKYVKPSGRAGFDQAINNYYASTESAFAINPSKAGSEIKTAWTDAVNRVLAGQQGPEQALKQAQSEAAKAYSAVK